MDQDPCKRCRQALPELAALELARAQAREPHLLVCDGCRNELRRYRELTARLDAALPDEQQEDLTDLVLARVAREPDPAWLQAKPAAPAPGPPPEDLAWTGLWTWTRRLVPAFGLALVLLVAVKVARPPGGEPRPSAGQLVTALACTGSVEALRDRTWTPVSSMDTLQDGSLIRTVGPSRLELRLVEGSRVTFLADTGARIDGRTVELERGRARFEVAGDPARTFRVRVPDGEIRVLGTVFEVEVSPAGSTRVTLLDGGLEVESRGRTERLVPGQTATLSGGRLQVESGTASPAPVAAPASCSPSTAPTPTATATATGPWAHPRVVATAASGPPPAGINGR